MTQHPKGRPNRLYSMLRLLLVFVVFGAGLLGYRAGCAPPLKQGRVAVRLLKVVDGDTIRVSHGNEDVRVRLIGIDAAELGSAVSFRCALEAAELLEAAARIEIEPEPSKPRDKYGRTLAWVWITDQQGRELLLQEELVRAGLCELYRDARGSKYYSRLELAWRVR
jgi:endonuclease YncB( thermonuclease family)